MRVDFDSDLVAKSLGDEDFVQAVAAWAKSPEAEAAQRGIKLESLLKKADE